jgi:hypothetical protein
MIDYRYAFVCNSMDNDLYALVMSCWYVDIDGNRVEVKSETQLDKTLTECFEFAQAFVIQQ